MSSTLVVNEDFIGLYNVPSIDSNRLVFVIKDCLQCLNISITKARGQCYDGASNMRGARNGVAKQIADIEKHAVFTHCYGHALNLACSDSVKGCKIIKDSLDIAYEITKLIKFSPRREGIFNTLKKQDI